jgi:mono/diheme cytochrome c family protein
MLVIAPAASRAAEDDLGRAIYANCASCHGPEGKGGRGPALAADQNLAITPYVASHVLTGSTDMPPFSEQLSDDEIAAVLTYARSHWGNRMPPVSREEIAAARKSLGLTATGR